MHSVHFQRGLMPLSDAILRARLTRPFRYFESVGSTNDIAKAWLEEGAPEAAAVIANEQRQGRGRRGRRWHTPPDTALALSVILHPPPRHLWRIGLVGALSVYDLADWLGCADIGIKWPNDVQVDGQKIGGILPEAVWRDDAPLGVVLGIGVNVRADFRHTALQDRAANLESAVNRPLYRADLIDYLLRRVEAWYRLMAADALFVAWKQRLNMLGRRIQTENIVGLALDVNPDGSLLALDDCAVIHSLAAGDIFIVNHGVNHGEGD